MSKRDKRHLIIGLDIETTGLEPDEDQICELGLVLIDFSTLTIRSEYQRVISGNDQLHILDRPLGEYARNMHKESGLYAEMLDVGRHYDHFLAESGALSWLHYVAGLPDGPMSMADKPVLLGSSVHFDRAFLDTWMPLLSRFFHYRHIDVSSIKEIVSHWYPDIAAALPDYPAQGADGPAHRVLPDLRYTLKELQYYRQYTFVDREW